MPQIDFTEDDLEQFEPLVREALLRLARQQLESQEPRQPTSRTEPNLQILEHKKPEDLEAEWRRRYNQGVIHVDPT